MRRHPGPAQPLERLAVQLVGGAPVGQQRPDRAAAPRAQSVPLAAAISDSRRAAPAARSGWSLRTAASTSSYSAHGEMTSSSAALARSAASAASR